MPVLPTVWGVTKGVRLKGSLNQQREVPLDYLEGNVGKWGKRNLPGKSRIAFSEVGTILVELGISQDVWMILSIPPDWK